MAQQQSDWDLLLPVCEFTLNTSHSTGFAPAFVLYGCNPILPLEHAVRRVVDGPVYLVAGYV